MSSPFAQTAADFILRMGINHLQIGQFPRGQILDLQFFRIGKAFEKPDYFAVVAIRIVLLFL